MRRLCHCCLYTQALAWIFTNEAELLHQANHWYITGCCNIGMWQIARECSQIQSGVEPWRLQIIGTPKAALLTSGVSYPCTNNDAITFKVLDNKTVVVGASCNSHGWPREGHKQSLLLIAGVHGHRDDAYMHQFTQFLFEGIIWQLRIVWRRVPGIKMFHRHH